VSDGDGGEGRVHKAGLFDIRTFIAALLGFDGIVILLMGLFGDQSTSSSSKPPININLWAGLALVIAAVIFESWKRLRPVKVVEPPPGSDEAPRAAH
jgi:high-affinity Fe2+/Pb2+ permease